MSHWLPRRPARLHPACVLAWLLFAAVVRFPSANTSIGSGSAVLEARWDAPDEPMGVVVFCHPHPRYGGTMHAPLMYRVTRGLVELGYAVLRFNFRGVGASTGTLGTGEVEDVDAAVTAARRFQPRVGVAGWSFGALASLRWQDLERDASPYVGIGLPTDMIEVPLHLPPAPRTLIIGDHDQFTTVDATRRFAAQIEAGVEVLPGSDHFFAFRHHRLVEIMDRTFAQRVDR